MTVTDPLYFITEKLHILINNKLFLDKLHSSSSSSLLKLFGFCLCLNGMCKVESIPIYRRDQILYSYIKFFDLRPCITSKVVKFVVFHKQVLARCFSDLLFIIELFSLI